jgi:hypothetical protein
MEAARGCRSADDLFGFCVLNELAAGRIHLMPGPDTPQYGNGSRGVAR